MSDYIGSPIFSNRSRYTTREQAKRRAKFQGPQRVRKAVGGSCRDHGIDYIERKGHKICPVCRSTRHP